MYFNLTLFAQKFSGKIVDNEQNPIIASSVFIKEINQGLICNENGEFQTTLTEGIYTVRYQCIGYKPVQETITINKDDISQVITLEKKIFELQEIIISNKEDPAYGIMRQAIKKAPYHLNKVNNYRAQAYIRGNMELTKVSGIVNKLVSIDGVKLSDLKNNLYLQESYNEIEFSAPDNYKQTVKAFSSTIPDNFNPEDVMMVIQSSLYSPVALGKKISPLNPKAFSYYRFKYEGFLEDNKQIVNKIKVIPKVKDNDLVEGYIYIADNSWDIRLAELSGNTYGIKQHYSIIYGEVSPSIYMPISYNCKIDGGILGTNGYFNYYASVKYLNINTKDFIKEDSTIKKKEKVSFEIKNHKNRYIETDSLATKRNSSFWTHIRNIPLTEKEIKSIQTKDLVQHKIDSIRGKIKKPKIKVSDLLLGGNIGNDSTKIILTYDGLISAVPEYNFVDGFWIGQGFSVETKLNKDNNKVKFSPKLYYATSRKKLIWETSLSLEYAPMSLGYLTVSVGNVSEDYNPWGITRFDNAISSLMWGDNVSMLYQKNYVMVKNDIDITNGLRFSALIQTAKRHGLQNNTDYNLFGDNNIKSNWYMPYNFDLTSYKVGLSYTPRHYYSVRNGKKHYEYAKSPTFTLNYSEGFSSWQKNNSKFRQIEGNISQIINTDYFGYFSYNINGGTFLGNKNRSNIADYKHFKAANMFTITNRPFDTFMLLNNYVASTNDFWAEGHFNYYNKYILLKRLPFLQGQIFNECLHLKYLYTPNMKHYNEIGYSLDLSSLLTLGIHTSFKDLKYQSFAVRLSYSILDIIKN